MALRDQRRSGKFGGRGTVTQDPTKEVAEVDLGTTEKAQKLAEAKKLQAKNVSKKSIYGKAIDKNLIAADPGVTSADDIEYDAVKKENAVAKYINRTRKIVSRTR